jgi:hypothetical protein
VVGHRCPAPAIDAIGIAEKEPTPDSSPLRSVAAFGSTWPVALTGSALFLAVEFAAGTLGYFRAAWDAADLHG